MNFIIKIVFILFVFISLSNGPSNAQILKSKTTRVLFLLDGSSSMLDNWNGSNSRFEAAQQLIAGLMDSVIAVNANVEFGLRVFGHQHIVTEKNCKDSKMEVNFRRLSNEQIKTRLKHIYPQGVSPIAWSLQEAANNDININDEYAYSIILITDGGESCDGSICDVMSKLVNSKINFQPYIVSLLDYAPLVKEYECMGKYLLLTKSSDYVPTIQYIMGQNNYFKANENTKYIPPVVKIDTPIVKVTPKVDTPIIKIIPKVDTPIVKVIPKVDTPKITTQPSREKITKLSLANFPKGKIFYTIDNTQVLGKVIVMKLPKIMLLDFEKTTVDTPIVKSIPKVDTPIVQKVEKVKLEAITPFPYSEFPKARMKYDIKWGNVQKTIVVKRLPTIKIIEIDTPKPVVAAKEKISKFSPILPSKHWRMTTLTTIPVDNKIKIKGLPKISIPTETTYYIPEKPKTTTDPNITQEQKNDQEAPGTFQIFYSNGKGKYYKTQADIVIVDLDTKKEAYRGVRKMNTNGEPKMETLPPGNYEITSVRSGRKAQFSVEKGVNKKVEIVVGSGSLSFVYKGTNELAKGYIAVVSKRFEEAFPAVDQPTEIVLTYEPANYHIEINTLPPLLLNIDLEFDHNYSISIPKTGKVNVINTNEIGRINFYHQTAATFILFHEMNIYGDVEYQKVDFLPGTYKVKYQVKNDNGNWVSKSKEFKLYSTNSIDLLLD